ncbi:NACHT domain-containing protein [Phormidesmis sp. 146-12]
MTPDPFSSAIALEISKIVIKTVWEGGGKLAVWMGGGLNDAKRNVIFQASNRYVQNYSARHGILKVLGMREPVTLESVYAAVRFLDNRALQSFESVEALEEAYRLAARRSFQGKDCPKKDGLKVANEKQYLMVLGGPGAGKSTFLRRMGLEALKGRKGTYQHDCIPVFIDLKEFNTGEIDIEKTIAREFGICGFPSPEESTQKLLQQGKLLVLLDGLDEVATGRMNEAISQIQNFVDLHNQNRYITSCRVAAYRHNFRLFTDVAMADFDDQQIKQFIDNWFRQDPDIAKDCWQKLNSDEHTAAKELTQTPLLLTLVCLLYQRSRKFPTNRSTLYERALRVLLEEWAAEKGIPQDDLYKGLDTKRKEMMLAEIAHDAFQQNRLFSTRREIVNQIEQLLKEMLPDEKRIDGSAVLRSIEVQHGVLVERADGIYSFSHLTLQEFLTAQYIDDHRQVEQLVTDHLTEARWKEIFLLVSGLMRGGADELLLLMEKEAQTYLKTPKIKAWIAWADQSTAGSAGDFKPAAKRAAAIFLAFAVAVDRDFAFTYRDRDLTATTAHYDYTIAEFALSLVWVFDLKIEDIHVPRIIDLARAIARAIEKIKIFRSVNFVVLDARLEALQTKIPNDDQPVEVRRAFRDKVLQTWYNALNLNLELLDLSEAETKALKDYFHANLLMVQCRQSAVRVSPATWAGIEDRMVTLRE